MRLVTGCGRSGTKFMARWYRKSPAQLDIGHEKMGKDGISSWYMAKPGVEYPPWHAEISPETVFDDVVHLIRNPLKVIASSQTLSSASWAWLQPHIDIDPLGDYRVSAMIYWHDWNKLAEESGGEIVQVESVPDLGLGTQVNSRKHPPVTWDELMRVDEDLCCRCKRLAEEYGYASTD